jgi:hypothetical protein
MSDEQRRSEVPVVIQPSHPTRRERRHAQPLPTDHAAAVESAAEGLRRRGHRTLKLDERVTRVITEAIGKGIGVRLACQAAGIGATTYSHWMQKGRAGREPYASFVRAVDEGRRACHERMERIIYDAAPGDWRAAKYWLQCHDPEWAEHRRDRDDDATVRIGQNFAITIHAGPPPGGWYPSRKAPEAISGMAYPPPIPNLVEQLPVPPLRDKKQNAGEKSGRQC